MPIRATAQKFANARLYLLKCNLIVKLQMESPSNHFIVYRSCRRILRQGNVNLKTGICITRRCYYTQLRGSLI